LGKTGGGHKIRFWTVCAYATTTNTQMSILKHTRNNSYISVQVAIYAG